MDGNGMAAAPSSPSGSNLPALFRWGLGGVAALASGSGSASVSAWYAAVAAAGVSGPREEKEVDVECGRMPPSQEDLLARAPFLHGANGRGCVDEEEAEVFSTPPLTQQDPQGQGQSQQGQAGEGEGEDIITMCTMPFTPTQPSSPPPVCSPSSDTSDPVVSKPPRRRKCTRKVRRGARLRTPSPEIDPLVRAVLMIPTSPLPDAEGDILELARSRGIF